MSESAGNALEVVADVHGQVEIEEITPREVESFPTEHLPSVLGKMVSGIAAITGVPEAMTGPLVLAAASACLGKGLAVKSLRGLTTRGNIYVQLAKASGSGGSVAYHFALSPIMGRQADLRRRFNEEDRPRLEAERTAANAEVEKIRSTIKKGVSGIEREDAIKEMEGAQRRLQDAEDSLNSPLLAMSDATSEGAASLLEKNGEVLLHADSDATDALASILGRYNGDKNQTAEALWLKCFEGGEITIVRKNNATIYLTSPCLTVCFVVTPEKVRELFRQERLTEGGLLPRFFVCDPKARPKLLDVESMHSAQELPSDVAQPYEAACWACLEEYRNRRNKKPAIIDMEPIARARVAEDWNRYAQLAMDENRQLTPFEARETEKAIRLAVVLHAFQYIDLKKKSSGTWTVSCLSAHETPLSDSTMYSALKIRNWFTRNLEAFLEPQREAAEDAAFEKVKARARDYPEGFTARLLYSGNLVATNKAEAETLLEKWVGDGRLKKIEPEPGSPGRRAVKYKLSTMARAA